VSDAPMSGSPIIQKRPENSEAKEVKVIPFFSSAMRKISKKIEAAKGPRMNLHRLRNFGNYLAYQRREADALAHHWSVLQ